MAIPIELSVDWSRVVDRNLSGTGSPCCWQVRDSPYKGVVDCVRIMVSQEGVGSLFKSLRTTVSPPLPLCVRAHAHAHDFMKTKDLVVACASAQSFQNIIAVPFAMMDFDNVTLACHECLLWLVSFHNSWGVCKF